MANPGPHVQRVFCPCNWLVMSQNQSCLSRFAFVKPPAERLVRLPLCGPVAIGCPAFAFARSSTSATSSKCTACTAQLPKLLELVGLGYTVWFTYRYLLFKVSNAPAASMKHGAYSYAGLFAANSAVIDPLNTGRVKPRRVQ